MIPIWPFYHHIVSVGHFRRIIRVTVNGPEVVRIWYEVTQRYPAAVFLMQTLAKARTKSFLVGWQFECFLKLAILNRCSYYSYSIELFRPYWWILTRKRCQEISILKQSLTGNRSGAFALLERDWSVYLEAKRSNPTPVRRPAELDFPRLGDCRLSLLRFGPCG